jgi:hypothetical protein
MREEWGFFFWCSSFSSSSFPDHFMLHLCLFNSALSSFLDFIASYDWHWLDRGWTLSTARRGGSHWPGGAVGATHFHNYTLRYSESSLWWVQPRNVPGIHFNCIFFHSFIHSFFFFLFFFSSYLLRW